jgi:hypothetical protein
VEAGKNKWGAMLPAPSRQIAQVEMIAINILVFYDLIINQSKLAI